MNWFQFCTKAITVPFVERGRDYDGWDCWGLVYRAYKDVLGVVIPDYLERYENTREFKRLSEIFAEEQQAEWHKVDDSAVLVGDVAIIKRRSLCIHTGIIVSNGQILHAEENVGTVIEPVAHLDIEGFYEWGEAKVTWRKQAQGDRRSTDG